MNYLTNLQRINKKVNSIINTITSQLTDVNTTFEFMWKKGIIDGVNVHAIMVAYLHGLPYFFITDGNNTELIDDFNACDMALLADIIIKDKKYRIENGFGITTEEDMNSMYGNNWWAEKGPVGKMLNYAATEAGLLHRNTILRGLGMKISSKENVEFKYHDITYSTDIMSAISVDIIER